MLSGFSFPVNLDRSRNKERLEASLAGLLELQFLRQRQEFLVKGALQIAGCRRDHDPFAFNWDLNGGDTFSPGAGFREPEGGSLRRHLVSVAGSVTIYPPPPLPSPPLSFLPPNPNPFPNSNTTLDSMIFF